MPFDREALASCSRAASRSYPSDLSSNPPPENSWVEECHRAYPRWKALRDSSQRLASRVNQFDAARLDVEMSAMLKEQLVRVFSLMKPGFLFQYGPELDAFLEFLVWRFSIWVDKPTTGNALMNLRYRDERSVSSGAKAVRTGLEGPGLSVSQKIWYYLTMVGGQYLWSQVQSFSAFQRWGDSEFQWFPFSFEFVGELLIWEVLIHPNSCFRDLSHDKPGFYYNTSRDYIKLPPMATFWYSLYRKTVDVWLSRCRSIIERVLKARLVYGSPNMNRAVSFEYMNRQLVWNEFSLGDAAFASSSIVRLQSRFLLPFSKVITSASSVDEAVCPICQSNPAIPLMALPCQQRYCYYCLRAHCAVSSYCCARCSESVIAIQRYGASETSTSSLLCT